MMENIYVIKVKTKPPLSSLYPSERRYSASTVGGLSFVHFGLGFLSLLLGTLALSLQGPVLSIACLVPFVTGLLAWKRWYIDRNISIFFYGSLFSLIVATLCFIATIFDIAGTTGVTRGSLWSLERILDPPLDHRLEENLPLGHTRNYTFADDTVKEDVFNVSDEHRRSIDANGESPFPTIAERSYEMRGDVLSTSRKVSVDFSRDSPKELDDLKQEASLSYERQTSISRTNGIPEMELEAENLNRSVETISDSVISFWHKTRQESSQMKTLLTINVLIASLLEIFWSLLSARIALRGMTNRLPEARYCGNVIANSKPEAHAGHKRKPPPPRPDILEHGRRLSNGFNDLRNLNSFRISGPRLPLPESSREFRERVEKFLANQAAHRVVEEGSTT